MKIAIIGAGIIGLTAGYQLSRKGHQITIFEKEKFSGGLAAGFKKKNWGWHLDFFYHHLFTSDDHAKNLIKELELEKKLFYLRPKTSIFKNKRIYQFDSPFSALRFPPINLPNRLRTGLITLFLKINPRWQNLEKNKASSWLKKYYGREVYKTLWQPLLKSKFGHQIEKVSMAWFWARIKKRSARLGYLEGGFQTLIDKLEEEIKNKGGKIYLNQEIKSLNEIKSFDKIIISAPTNKFFPKTKLPKMLGAISLILELKKKFLEENTYWLNINEEGFPFVAVVEQTNFIDKKNYGNNHLVYVGGYYPQNHPYFKMTKEQVLKEFLPYLKKINPNFDQSSVISFQLSANLFAQPVIPTHYSQIIPSH
ncbi:MAG TPA: FAD-dependent oxidoreductase, partial [Patescibacteria group bacterium]|nr:FAD-dependent oxidoreductase [Patescibacteria group bacterium]